MMRIFKIENDVNRYQYFLAEETRDRLLFLFDGTPRLDEWTPPPVFVYKPKHKAGNFYNFGGGYLIADQKATEALRTHFEMAGELLPLPYKGDLYTVLNVTECIDCLDHDRTTWYTSLIDGQEIRAWIKQFVFRPDRLSESPLFKIPEAVSSIFLVEGFMEPGDEFREIFEREGLKGLTFDQVWSDGDDEGSQPA